MAAWRHGIVLPPRGPSFWKTAKQSAVTHQFTTAPPPNQTPMTASQGTAIVAKRADSSPVETDEIQHLVEAAGYEVGAVLTQVRPEDPGTHLGAGKVEEVMQTARAMDASVIVIDGALTSGQARNLRLEQPEGTRLMDRYRLVLDIFAEQATDRRAQLQVELTQLQFELDWFNEVSDESLLTKYGEKGSRRYQLQDRISTLKRKLAELPDPGERFRERRREEGFDLVTLAGYTNAGKSTLLHRLADDLTLGGATGSHPDQTGVAEIEDRLFKTLETTTRRATLDGRPVLCTDTVGYVRDLPHDLVVAFAETLSEAGTADVIVLITEASDPLDRFEAKLEVACSVFDALDVSEDQVLPVLNKIDLVDDDTIEVRCDRLARFGADPVSISAKEGTNLEQLTEAIVEALPTDAATIELPYGDEAMSFVSSAHERASVTEVEYTEDSVALDTSGRPDVIRELTSEATRLGGTVQ